MLLIIDNVKAKSDYLLELEGSRVILYHPEEHTNLSKSNMNIYYLTDLLSNNEVSFTGKELHKLIKENVLL
jgi:hypothetical protein